MANKPTKLQIGLSGWCGTGTSTVAKLLVERLGGSWKRVSPASDHFRAVAQERYPNLPKEEALIRLEKDAVTDLSIDQSCDAQLRTLAETQEFFVADARLSGMLLPEGIRVYLHCEDIVRYRRIAGREGVTTLVATNQTIAREESSLARYSELYGVSDLAKQCDFHLVLDSGVLTPEDICDKIAEYFYEAFS